MAEKVRSSIYYYRRSPISTFKLLYRIPKITQNRAGDITMKCIDDKVHFYVSNAAYEKESLSDEQVYDASLGYYIGSLTVEKEYTL